MAPPDAYAAPASFAGRLRAVAALFKLRLTSLVVVSAVLGYLLAGLIVGFIAFMQYSRTGRAMRAPRWMVTAMLLSTQIASSFIAC